MSEVAMHEHIGHRLPERKTRRLEIVQSQPIAQINPFKTEHHIGQEKKRIDNQ